MQDQERPIAPQTGGAPAELGSAGPLSKLEDVFSFIDVNTTEL